MKQEQRYICRFLLAAAMLLVTACTNDSEEKEGQLVTVLPYSASFFETNPMTRALPTGYVRYSELYPTTTPDHTTISLKLKRDNEDEENSIVRYVNNKWTATIDLEDATYYIYGFMPNGFASGMTLAKNGGSYANGAIMTINNLNVLTPADVCAVVGVKGGTEPANIEDVGIQLGQFNFLGHATEDNYLYLLLKHLYAGLHFKLHIDSEYAKLRTIKVKRLTLTTVNEIYDRINLVVTLSANNDNTDPCTSITYTDITANAQQKASTDLYNNSAGFTLPISTSESVLGCFAPGKCNQFELESVYDIYDKKGNLIRQDCRAKNSIDLPALLGSDYTELAAGEIYTIDLKIQPTYLYTLSDKDLDNPSFVIE